MLRTGVWAWLCGAVAWAAEVPAAFEGLLAEGGLVKAETVMVVPPQEIDKYVGKVEKAANQEPEWFAKYSKDAPPGVPLPFHEKLGLSKEEYQQYLDLWNKREFRSVANVVLQLKQPKKGEWTINATGDAGILATLRYVAEKDVFESPNGTLKRIEDIDAGAQSILGKWQGKEWRYLEETSLGMTKENIALGRSGDGKSGLIVYRVQEVSAQGTRLYDRSIVVRFVLGGSGAGKEKK
jgi:hypothetical protein